MFFQSWLDLWKNSVLFVESMKDFSYELDTCSTFHVSHSVSVFGQTFIKLIILVFLSFITHVFSPTLICLRSPKNK